MEPIRRPIAEKGYKYYEASCIDVDPAGKKIVCRAEDPSFECADDADECPWHAFDVEYDYLVTAVGAVPNTFGVPGVEEHAMFFKEIVHASKFRREVNERFERATLPDVPEARLKELLSFVVIGAGLRASSSRRSCTTWCTRTWRRCTPAVCSRTSRSPSSTCRRRS